MKQYGSFGRLDTCSYVEFFHSEKCYILWFGHEDKAVSDNYGVNNNLDVSLKHKLISSETVNSMHNKAQKFKCETVVYRYSKVATYIPFKCAIVFQENRRY